MRKLWVLVLIIVVAASGCNHAIDQFNSLVTDKVIGEAVEKIAKEDFYTEGYLAWHANLSARHAVYHNQFGEGWFDKVYASLEIGATVDATHSDSFWVARGGSVAIYQAQQKILEVCRERLRDPARLQKVYLKFKTPALREIKKQGAEKKFGQIIDQALPFFQGQMAEGASEYHPK